MTIGMQGYIIQFRYRYLLLLHLYFVQFSVPNNKIVKSTNINLNYLQYCSDLNTTVYIILYIMYKAIIFQYTSKIYIFTCQL